MPDSGAGARMCGQGLPRPGPGNPEQACASPRPSSQLSAHQPRICTLRHRWPGPCGNVAYLQSHLHLQSAPQTCLWQTPCSMPSSMGGSVPTSRAF